MVLLLVPVWDTVSELLLSDSFYITNKKKIENEYRKRIVITGAGSGFGEGTAIGLAQKGHEVIAGAHIWPQVTRMRKKAKSLRLNNLRIEKLDILTLTMLCMP